jgi:hypothetical protein
MSSQAKIEANRRNAEKSTGPKTEEGKAVVAQNAVKHGLLGRQDVVSWEDQEQFEIHRGKVLGELAPVGVMETILAERVVSLTWRLQRAQRMQTEAMNYLTADRTEDKSLASLLKALAQKNKPTPRGDRQTQGQYAIGRSLCKDWANDLVLDRMLMYERRIESSLFRTSAELQRLQLMRRLEESDGGTGYQAPAGQQRQAHRVEPSQPAGGAACEARPMNPIERPCPAPAEASCEAPDGHAGAELTVAENPEEAPYGVSTNEECETKPNSEDRVSCGVEVTALPEATGQELAAGDAELSCETKPMSDEQAGDGQCPSCEAPLGVPTAPLGHRM